MSTIHYTDGKCPSPLAPAPSLEGTKMESKLSDARPDAFPKGDARWARNDPASRMPNGLRIAVWHGESGTVFHVMRLEGEYWESVGSRRTRHEAERLAWEVLP